MNLKMSYGQTDVHTASNSQALLLPNQTQGSILLLCTKNHNSSDFVYLHRAKHPVKVHVWAAISLRSSTEICVFLGIMDATLYIKILNDTLLPFIRDTYPAGHRLMRDNNLKHTSRQACAFMQEKEFNWWKIPPESPDAKAIENVWHELKEYLRREVNSRNKNELVKGIIEFWLSMDQPKCLKYIKNLRKVIPRIEELHGSATGQ